MIKVTLATKVFGRKNRVTALDQVSLELKPGTIVGLLGPNGAGKTTLVRLISGLLLPDEGQVQVDGFDTLRKRREVAARIGCLLEGNRNVYQYLTVWDNLLYFGLLNRLTYGTIKRRAAQLLDLLDLSHKRRDYVFALSRGMQQKLALALALIKDPPYLLLDEPTLGLDVETSLRLRSYLGRLRDQGKGILLTTHQLDVAERLSDDIVFIKRGRIAHRGTKASILRDLNLVRTGFQCSVAAKDAVLLNGAAGEVAGVTPQTEEGPVLTVHCQDQAALCRLLSVVEVLDIRPAEPSLEEVFLAVMRL